MESGFTINIIECESKLGTRGRINISAAENEVLLPSSTLDSLKKQVLTKSDVPLLPQEKKKQNRKTIGPNYLHMKTQNAQ